MTPTHDIRRALRARAKTRPASVQHLTKTLCEQLRTATRHPESTAARSALLHSVRQLAAEVRA